nr:importin-5-like [Tanacetum cinerariifolium]
MNVVMPPLLHSAQLEPDVIITSADSDSEINESHNERGASKILSWSRHSNDQARLVLKHSGTKERRAEKQ